MRMSRRTASLKKGSAPFLFGQYLQPSRGHLPVSRFVSPEKFLEFENEAKEMGFSPAACGPMVRSSYHADVQAHGIVEKG